MNRSLQFAFLLGIIFSFFAACEKKDKVVYVKDNDPEMEAAIAKARETLPHFWQTFDKPERGETDFALKVCITDEQGTEYFWANDIEKRDGKVWATINNEPNIVVSVKLGDRIEVPEADIADWLYMREGKAVGNRTIVPLFKDMPPKEVEAYRRMMAEP